MSASRERNYASRINKMAHEAAFILDQLMGRNRDVVPGEGNENDRNWSDPDVSTTFRVLATVR